MIDKNVIPKSWTVTNVENLCEVVTGNTPPKNDLNNYGNAIPFVKPPQLFDKPIIDAPEKLSLLGVKYARILPKNSILVTCIGNLGRTGINKVEVAFNQQINALIPLNDLSSKYIFYQAQSSNFKKQLEGLASATTIPIVNKGKFQTIQISVAPLSEQQRIVDKIEELFSELDKGIESLKAAQQQLKVYRQAVLKWAFEGKLTNDNITNGKLPLDWKEATIEDVCVNVEYGSAAKSKEIGRIPVLRMGNIQNGRVDWNDLVYTDDEDEIKKYSLRKNDVLFNRTNSSELVGKTAIYKGERPAIFAGYLIRINIKESLINADYLNYFLNSHIAKSHGDKVKSFGVNQSNINGTKLKAYPLPICSIEEQTKVVQEIESRLSVCDKIEDTIEQSLKQAEALRQSILKKAFEGKLVPQDPNDEPASKLLEKIRAAKQVTEKLTTKNSKLKIQN